MRLLNPLAWWRDGKPRPKARRTPARRPGARSPKRGAHKVGARQLWQRGGIVFAAALVLAVMGWLSTGGWIQRGLERAELALLAATAEAGLMLGDVLVEGRERTERRVVLETLGVVPWAWSGANPFWPSTPTRPRRGWSACPGCAARPWRGACRMPFTCV
jgi:hypothetical protein